MFIDKSFNFIVFLVQINLQPHTAILVRMTKLESIAKYAGFITVAIEWSALLMYYLRMPLYFGGMYPISYFATLPETRWVFTLCYVLAALSFWIFAKHYLAKYYRVPLRIFAVSLVLFAGVGLFPYDPHNFVSDTIHSGLVLLSGMLFLVGMLRIALHAKDNSIFTVTMTAAALSFILACSFLLTPKDGPFVFPLEAASWLVLQLWTIWISVYVRRHSRILNAQA